MNDSQLLQISLSFPQTSVFRVTRNDSPSIDLRPSSQIPDSVSLRSSEKIPPSFILLLSQAFNGTADFSRTSPLTPTSDWFSSGAIVRSVSPRDSTMIPFSPVFPQSPTLTLTDTFTSTRSFSVSDLHGPTLDFNATVLSRKAYPAPNHGSSPLGLILGIVFGLLAVIAFLIAGAVYVRWQRTLSNKAEESERDEATTFYNDNRNEIEKEYELAFDNPVFEDNAAGASSEAFENDSGETLQL
jgi:hypothetical protein